MEEALAAVSAIVLLLGCYAGCGRGKKKKKEVDKADTENDTAEGEH
jgi:hypothetical protein